MGENYLFLSTCIIDDNLKVHLFEADSLNDAWEYMQEIAHNFENSIYVPTNDKNKKVLQDLLDKW